MENIETYYNDIIKWLEAYYEGREKVATYRGLEYSREFAMDIEKAREEGTEFFIDPLLPIDLVMVQTEQEPSEEELDKLIDVHYYILFWLVSSGDASTERRLQFYRFYLSRISPLKAVQVVMVIPASIGGGLEQSLREIADENGFGLWRIETSNREPEKLCTPKNFLKHMEDALKNPPEDMEGFEPCITDKAPEISLFFDRYVRESVEALAGVTPRKVGKRYIERKLLDTVFELQNISYAGELKKLVTKHLIDKGDDYEFVSQTFSALWRECKLGMNYSDFLKVYEPPLYNIFATREKPYRDHYLHQFQVFLLGLYIADQLYSKFPPNIDKQWLITSSLHDMAYPLQLYEGWAKDFFKEALGIPEMGELDVKSHFVDKSLLSSLGFLIDGMCKLHFGGELQGNWLDKEKALVRFFYKGITQVKHHCILGSLHLIKRAEQCSPNLPDDLFVPSALAIALHHEVIWRELPPERKLESLKFSNDPLAFLLMFCDCVQEWGRPKANKEIVGEEENERFILDQCEVQGLRCLVTIKTPYLSTTDKKFENKETELKNLERFLQSPADMEFKITLIDKSGTIREYRMTGPSTQC